MSKNQSGIALDDDDDLMIIEPLNKTKTPDKSQPPKSHHHTVEIKQPSVTTSPKEPLSDEFMTQFNDTFYNTMNIINPRISSIVDDLHGSLPKYGFYATQIWMKLRDQPASSNQDELIKNLCSLKQGIYTAGFVVKFAHDVYTQILETWHALIRTIHLDSNKLLTFDSNKNNYTSSLQGNQNCLRQAKKMAESWIVDFNQLYDTQLPHLPEALQHKVGKSILALFRILISGFSFWVVGFYLSCMNVD
jgi:hypothetical protein